MYRYWSLWGLFLAEQVTVTDFMDVVCRSRAFDGMIFKKSSQKDAYQGGTTASAALAESVVL